MSELLQEFVDSREQRLRVDRTAGVIRGVKLLGLASRNGRRYRESALVEAAALYEGAKVNVNHPKGHPLSPRDYQDRLGAVRGVQFRAGAGLFGDLHFNPKHTLSEQLVWDAEHAPQNVGMSHNVLARTTRRGDEIVVEAITKVQSIDLVADPATTAGLFENVEGQESRYKSQEPERKEQMVESNGTKRAEYCLALDSRPLTLDSATLEQLRTARPDLTCEIENAYESRLESLQTRLDEMVAREELARRRERIEQLLQEHELPLPREVEGADSGLVGSQFLASLMRAEDEPAVRRLVEERAALVRSACRWNERQNPRQRRPRSRDQLAVAASAGEKPIRTAAEFATAINGR